MIEKIDLKKYVWRGDKANIKDDMKEELILRLARNQIEIIDILEELLKLIKDKK